MSNNQCTWPTGKALGGGSMHNGMLYVRGNRGDYDNWKELGNTGWGYDDVLPYFKKSEDMRIPDLRDSPYHGTGGHLTIERLNASLPVTEYILEAGRDIGYGVLDTNGESQAGFMYTQRTVRDGLRCSTAKAFLRSASHRKNLYVSTHSMVQKILVNETTSTAYGVQFSRGDETYIVYSNIEVILSAGTIRSPQVLMLSGIGPKEHLEEFGIQVIHDSPGVGQNLQDHVTTFQTTVFIDDPSKCSGPTDDKAESEGSSIVTVSGVKQFLYEKSGPMYETPGLDAVGFINTRYSESTSGYPDIELILRLVSGEGGDAYTLTATLLRPESRGYIKLRDTNPDNHPIIVPNYFNDPHDLDVLIEGAKISYNISQTPTMKKLNARINTTVIAECAQFNFHSDDYLRCHARHYGSTEYHPTSTCKMGPADDAMAVVDPSLRLYGVKALRVVDASIMPNVVSGNTNAPTIMIAEKAADLIKKDYNYEKSDQPTNAGSTTCTRKKE